MDVHALDFCSLFLLLLLNFKENSCQYGSSLNLQNAGSRPEPTFRGLFSRMADHRLSAIVSSVVNNSTVEDCAQRCVQETIYQCKSFDFDNGQRACLMFSVSVNDPDVHLISSAGRDHYQTLYSKLFNRLPNHMLTTTHNRRILQTSVEECARRCILEQQFKCRGFDYEVLNQACWLTELTPERAYGINVMDGWDYYERDPEGPLDRFVNYGFGHMRPLPGSTIYEREFRGVTLENCATLCLAAKDFHCLSFDYNFIIGNQQSTCHLSQFIAANVYGLSASPTKRTLHFERKEKYLTYFYATPYAVVLGNNHKQFSRVTPNRCAQYCTEEDAFVCRSFDYKIQDGTCILSSKTGSDVGGLYNQGLQEVHHFEMKPLLDCGGTLTDPQGGFASPNWPRNYAHHENCDWNITVHQYKVIKFRFTHIELGLAQSCNDNEDKVVIKWIDNWTSEPRSVCVVPNTKEIHANSNTASVSFVSNSQVDAQGFRVFYSEEWPCDAFLSKAPGEFASPDYPNNYPTSARCSWRLTAPEGHRVKVHFTEFQLEQNALNHCNDKFDHVIVLDGGTVNAARMGLYCGTHHPFTVRSSGRDMFIQFRSDISHSLVGFHAAYDFEVQDHKRGPYLGKDGLELDNGESDTTGLQGKSAKSTSEQGRGNDSGYKTAMWAALSTLLVLLIVVAVILFIVWKRHRGPLSGEEEVQGDGKTEHDAPKLAYQDCMPIVNTFRNRFRVFWKRGESDVVVTPEEVPLQEPLPMKQNNVIDLTKPTPAKRNFSNMLYDEPCTQQNNLNWKTVNLDTKP